MVISYWYVTPKNITKFSPGDLLKCIRGCNTHGPILHIWWECSKVKKMWVQVYNFRRLVLVMNEQVWVWFMGGSINQP